MEANLKTELVWIRVKGGPKPITHLELILHTPQFSDTLGSTVTGHWDEDEEAWVADDGRDFEGNPPIHYAYVTKPDFEGDDDEWSYDEDADPDEGDIEDA